MNVRHKRDHEEQWVVLSQLEDYYLVITSENGPTTFVSRIVHAIPREHYEPVKPKKSK